MRDPTRANPRPGPAEAGPTGRRADSSVGTASLAALLSAAAIALAPTGAPAQGFGIYEHGSCAMGRAGAVVADPCDDGSAIFFNPAALVRGDGITVTAGATVIAALGGFTDDLTGTETDLDNDPVPAPHLFATYGLTDRLAAGIGVYVPYGLETKWPLDFAGRFIGYDNSLQWFYIQPTVAYRILDRLSVGGGPVIAVGSVELNQRLDLSTQPVPPEAGLPEGTTFGEIGVPFQTPFADARLEADGAIGVGAHVGVQARVTDRIRVGARYLSRVDLDYDGDATFTPVRTGLTIPPNNPFGVPGGTPLDVLLVPAFSDGPLLDQGVETEITMPDQFVLGVSVRATDRLTLTADWQWVDWSDFDRIVLDFERPDTPDEVRVEDYGDTNSIRLGAELAIDREWTVRAGYLYHEAAAPDQTVTALLPEADRNEATIGFGWRPSPLVQVDLAYQLLAQNDRRGRVRDAPPGESPTTALNSGLYEFGANLFGGSITLRF